MKFKLDRIALNASRILLLSLICLTVVPNLPSILFTFATLSNESGNFTAQRTDYQYGVASNKFGNGINGSITISSDTTWSTGVRNYTSIIINSGKTLTIAAGVTVRCTSWFNNSGTVSANLQGGNGGASVSGSGVGGKGGGVLTIYAAKFNNLGTITASAGNGGNGITASADGSGIAGSAGSGGYSGGLGGAADDTNRPASRAGGSGGSSGGGGGSGAAVFDSSKGKGATGGGGGGGAGSISIYVYVYWSNIGSIYAIGGNGGNAWASSTTPQYYISDGGQGGCGGIVSVHYSPALSSITLGTVTVTGGSSGAGAGGGGTPPAGSAGTSSSQQDSTLLTVTSGGTGSTSYSFYWASTTANTTLRFDFSYSFPGGQTFHQLNCTFPKVMAVINLTETTGNTVVAANLYSVVSHNSTHMKVVIPQATLASKGYSYKLFVNSIGYVYSITPTLTDIPTSSTISFSCRLKDQNGNPLAQAVWVSIWDASVEKSHVSGTSNAQGWYNSTITAPSTAGTYYLRANTTGGIKQVTIIVFTGSALTSEYGSGFVQLVQYKYSSPSVLHEYYTTGADNENLQMYGSYKEAQTWTTTSAYTITMVSFELKKAGSPPNPLTVAIETTSSGLPTDTVLTSGAIAAASLTTSYVWYNITLTDYGLSNGVQYAIVLYTSGGDTSNYYYVHGDYSSSSYSGGTECYYGSTSPPWYSYAGKDLVFKTWATPTTSGSQAATSSNFWASTSANTTWRETFSYSFPGGSSARQLNCTFPLGRSIINLTDTTNSKVIAASRYSVVSHNSTHMKVIIPEAVIASNGTAYNLFTSSVSSVNSLLKDYIYNSPSRSLSFDCLLKKADGNVYASLDLWVSIWNSTAEISHVTGTTGAGGWLNSTITLPATIYSYNLRANCTGGVAYVTVYVTNITVTLSVSDARIDIVTPASMPGTALYSVDSSWVPSGTITVNGNSSTITSGAYTYAPQYNTVGQRTITVTAATDAGGCNSLTAQQSQNVVWDRIRITGSGVIDGRISISATGKFWATAILDYDSHALGSGDSLTIQGILMSWNATSSRFEGTDVQSSVTTVTYDTFTSGSEADYGITVGFMNGFSESISWDKARVYYQVLNDSTVTVGQAIEYRVKIILLLDGHALGSGDTVTANAGAMIWDAVNGWFEVTKVLNTAGNYTFSISSLLEDTYGIDAFEANVSDPMGTWEGWIVVTLSVPDDRIDVSTNATILVAAEYGWNGTACSLSSITLNDTTTKASPGTYGYNVSAAVESYYGITNVTCNSVSVGFDRLVEFDKGNNITGTVHPSEWVREWFKLRSELDGAFMESGSLSINGSAATWDPGSSYWYLDVPVNWWNVTKAYVVTAASWDVYGIDTLNSGVATNSTSFTSTGWVAVTLSFSRTRIDLGTNAITYLIVTQVYGWNGTACSLTVYALNDTTTKGSVGTWWFKMASLTESIYDITNFTTNSVSMTWDIVEGLLNLSGAVLHRIDAGSNATILFPQLWYASDHSPFSGTLTLNDTTTKDVPGRYGYEIASITDTLYSLTGFTTNATYAISDAMNVTDVTWGGMDSSGNIKLISVVKSAFDGSAFTGYVDINGTRGAIGATITVPFSQSGPLIVRGWNETTYGLTRAIANMTWNVYLVQYKLTSQDNKTVSATYSAPSNLLQFVATSTTVHIKCPNPYIVQIDGVVKAQGDGWSYSEATGVLQVTLPSSWANVYFSQPTSGGGGGGSGGGGFLYPTEVFLQGIFREEKKAIVGDRVMLILLYGLDNPTQKPIGAAWLLISLPDQYKGVAWDAVYEGQKQLIANSTTKLGEVKTQIFNVTYPDPRTIEVKIDYTAKVGNPWMAVWNIAGMKVTFGHLVALAICIPLLILGIFTHNIYVMAGSAIVYALFIAMFGIDMVPLAILPSTPGEWSAGLTGTANSLASNMVAWVYSFLDSTIWDSGVGLRLNIASLLIVISAAIAILKLKLGKK